MKTTGGEGSKTDNEKWAHINAYDIVDNSASVNNFGAGISGWEQNGGSTSKY